MKRFKLENRLDAQVARKKFIVFVVLKIKWNKKKSELKFIQNYKIIKEYKLLLVIKSIKIKILKILNGGIRKFS